MKGHLTMTRRALVWAVATLLSAACGEAQNTFAGGTCFLIAGTGSNLAIVADSKQVDSGNNPATTTCKLFHPEPKLLFGVAGYVQVQDRSGKTVADLNLIARTALSKVASSRIPDLRIALSSWSDQVQALVERKVFSASQVSEGGQLVSFFVATTNADTPTVLAVAFVRQNGQLVRSGPVDFTPGTGDITSMGSCTIYEDPPGKDKLTESELSELRAWFRAIGGAQTAAAVRADLLGAIDVFSHADERLQGDRSTVGPPYSSAIVNSRGSWDYSPAAPCSNNAPQKQSVQPPVRSR